jgi:hypothetical protein
VYQEYLNEHNYLEPRINNIKEGMIFDELFINTLNYIGEIDALRIVHPLKLKEKLSKHTITNQIIERSNSCSEQVKLNINKMIEELEYYEKESSELINKYVNKRK